MQAFQKTLLHLRVIILALVGGLAMLAAMTVYMVLHVKPGGFITGQGPQWNGLPLITLGFLGISLLILFMSYAVPLFIERTLIAQSAKEAQPVAGELSSWEVSDLSWLDRVPAPTLEKLLGIFQGNRITTVAMCEGGGITAAIAYLLEGQYVALGVVIASIGLMLIRVPTQASLNTWVFAQMERVK